MRVLDIILISTLILGISPETPAQTFLESHPVGTSRDGVLVVYGRSNIGNTRIPYDRISGSPFWKDQYQLATVLDNNNQVMGKAPVKLNLYTNEVYFLTPKGEERVVTAGLARKIIFHKGDNEKEVLAVFENNLPVIVENNPNAESPSFVQVMNNGDLQLLRHNKVLFVSADSLFGTMKRYYFSNQVIYYLNNKFGQNNRLRKLNRDHVMELINSDSQSEAWIKQNSINFKKEEDVIQFLDYLNSRKKG